MSPSRPYHPRRLTRPVRLRRRFVGAAVLAGAAATVLVLVAFAAAKALTVQIAAAGRVVDATGGVTREPLAVTGSGRAVYYLSGETSRHPKCTGVCLNVWMPVTVPAGAKPTKASSLPGTLKVWRRGSVRQVTLGGRPLYTFVPDHSAHVATGAGIVSFGGTWHVITTRKAAAPTPAPVSTTTSTSTSSNPYGY